MLAESLVGHDIRCIVDVGCGMGFSLRKNSHKMAIFSECWFGNVSHRSRRGSKIEGVEIHHLSFQQAIQNRWNRGEVDIITMNHVVEHLIDPKVDLQKSYDQLRPNGVLLIEIPHLNGWRRRWMKKNGGGAIFLLNIFICLL